MNQKYTAIFTEAVLMGSHQNTLTYMKRVEKAKNETAQTMLERCDIDPGSVVFLFEGHSPLEGESTDEAEMLFEDHQSLPPAEWEDFTSYSRSDSERVPSVWQLRVGDVRVHVHRHVDYDDDDWLVSASESGRMVYFDNVLLKAKTTAKAQREALTILKDKIRKTAEAFDLL